MLNRGFVDVDDRPDRGGGHLEELLVDVVPGTGTPAWWLARVGRRCVDGAVDEDQERSLAVATVLATCGRS